MLAVGYHLSKDHSIIVVLNAAASRLESAGVYFGHGTDNAFSEAFWLICHALGLSVHEPLPEIQLSTRQQEHIYALVERRIDSRQPAAYLTGSTWFAGLPILVTSDVLVPRSPIAELIINQFEPWLDINKVKRVLDLGTGSGCIALACAWHFSGVEVTGVDVSEQALKLALNNSIELKLDKCCHWLHSDIYSGLSGQRFDLIISNPPYVPVARQSELPSEYHAEPGLGLYSGEDGLDHAARILFDAHHHLEIGGLLVLEVGESAESLQAQLPMVPFVWLDFEQGGEGVLLAEQVLLQHHQHDINDWYQSRLGIQEA